MRSNPKISIAMTTYNTADYVKDAISSIVSQDYLNWELVIVDDYSRDKTVTVVKWLINHFKINDKTKLIQRNENAGYGRALKTAIEKSSGELVAIVDSDDALAREDALSIMVAEHGKHPEASLVYSTYYVCRGVKLTTEGAKTKKITPIPHGETYLSGEMRRWRVSHLKVFKREAYDKTDGLDERLVKSVDNDLVLKLEEVGSLIYIPEPLYFYRRRAKSITSSFHKKPDAYKNEAKRMRLLMIKNAKQRRMGLPISPGGKIRGQMGRDNK